MSEDNNLNELPNSEASQSGFPIVTGFLVFLESGPRQVAGLLRRFEPSRCRLLVLETIPSHPAALLKIVVTHHEEGRIILERAGLPFADYRLIATVLPEGVQPLLRIFLPLTQGNVVVRATHVIACSMKKKPIVLIEADPLERGTEILLAHGFDLVTPETLDQAPLE